MMKEGIARLLVVEGDNLVGIVTRADLVRGLGSRYGGWRSNAEHLSC